MIPDEKYPGVPGKRGNEDRYPGKDRINDQGSDFHEDDPGASFFDRIESLALRQKDAFSSSKEEEAGDLSSVTLNSFPEVESDERTVGKIEELNSIILSIENRPALPGEVRLERSYKTDYRRELNDAQLQAVTSLKGPVLVIAGAGSGKTRVIVYRVAFMLENGINQIGRAHV